MSEPIIFKCEDSLWRLMESGEKKFDMRRYDIADERIYRLSWNRYTPPLKGGKPHIEPQETFVSFANKETGALLMFRFKGLEFTDWAVGWVFIILGDPVNRTPNKRKQRLKRYRSLGPDWWNPRRLEIASRILAGGSIADIRKLKTPDSEKRLYTNVPELYKIREAVQRGDHPFNEAYRELTGLAATLSRAGDLE